MIIQSDFFFFSSRRRHTICYRDWSSDVCSSDLDVTGTLCAHLGITKVAAVTGTSGGGPTAVAMAARHPDLAERLILQSAVGPLPYPDRRTRVGAKAMFAAVTEPATWGLMRVLLRHAPDATLRMLLGSCPAELQGPVSSPRERREAAHVF